MGIFTPLSVAMEAFLFSYFGDIPPGASAIGSIQRASILPCIARLNNILDEPLAESYITPTFSFPMLYSFP